MSKLMNLMMCLVLASCMLTGCGSKEAAAEPVEAAAGESDQVSAPTEEAGSEEVLPVVADDPRNQDAIGEKELLVVSVGSADPESRSLAIGSVEKDLEEAFPGWSVRRAFTCQDTIDRIRQEEGVDIDSVAQALERAVDNGVKTLVIQPTHLLDSQAHRDLLAVVDEYADRFEQLAVGEPLIADEEDFKAMAQLLADATADYDDGQTAIVFVGMGTQTEDNDLYAGLQQELTNLGKPNCYVGTEEAVPGLEEVLDEVKEVQYSRVVLHPLKLAVDENGTCDPSAKDSAAWQQAFENAGYETVCIEEGLGQLEGVRALTVQHAQAAVDSPQAK